VEDTSAGGGGGWRGVVEGWEVGEERRKTKKQEF